MLAKVLIPGGIANLVFDVKGDLICLIRRSSEY
jgi:hypothetical protein